MSNTSSAADRFPSRARTIDRMVTKAEGAPGRSGSAWLASAVLGFACFMAVIALLTVVWVRRAPVPAPPADDLPHAIPEAPRWVDVTRPLATYDLAGGPYAKLPMRYEARRLEGGSARQDIVTYGVPQPGGAFVRLLFDRHDAEQAGEEAVGGATLFVEAARLAAGAGIAISRSGLPWTVATRFGPFETADVAAIRDNTAAPCVVLRRAAPVLSITGLVCGQDATAPGPVAVACMLDKLDLVSAGEDLPLRSLFVAAERQRRLGCVDGRTARPLADDAVKPIGASLRGSLPLGRDAKTR